MSSLPVQTDNSVQLSYSSFPFTITNVDNYASSNFVLSLSSNNSNYTKNASNALKANIDLKQDTLTAATNLLGIGTAITAIDYNKISVNKPTNFQADWNSTIINKPSTFPADMTNIYTKIETNNLITNTSNYTLNTSNALQTNINTTNNNISTNYLPKSGGTMTGLLTTANIDCGGGIVINGANAIYSPFGISDTTINAVDTSNSWNTYINFKDAGANSDWCYIRQIGGNNAYKLAFDFHDDNNDARFCIRNINSANNAVSDTTKEVFTVDNGNTSMTGTLTTTGVNIGSVSINNWLFNSSGFNHETISDFNNITGFGYRFINGLGSAPTNGPATGDTQYYSWHIGLGADYPAITGNGSYGMQFAIGRYDTNPKLCIRRRQDTAWTSWQGLTAEKAVSLTSGDKTISGILTATGGFSGSGASLSNLAYSNITGKPTNFQADWLTTIINKPTTFPADMTNIYSKIETNNLITNTSNYTLNASNALQANINAKEAILTFSSPLTRTTNTIGINLGSYSTTGNDANYLLKTGGTMTGTLTMTTGCLKITNNVSNPGDSSSASFWNQSGVGATISAFQITFQTNGITERMRINNDGNVSIATTDTATYKLNVNGSLNSTSLYQNGTLINFSSYATTTQFASYSTTGNDANYLLKTGGTMTGDLTISKTGARLSLKGTGAGAVTRLDLSAYDNTTFEPSCSFIITDDTAYSSSLNIKIKTSGANANSQFSALFIKPDGKIGIGSDAPNYKLDVNGSLNSTSLYQNGTLINFSSYATTSQLASYSTTGTDTNYLLKTGGTLTGLLTTTGNIDCGGGIAINGSTAFYQPGGVNDPNKTNTYINFKFGGTGSDWCYLRQIATGDNNNTFKLSFDFHDDDNDARFCIRRIWSAGQDPDNIKEVFSVDNGTVYLEGELINQYWKLTNETDYCRLYNRAGTSYYNFAARDLYAGRDLNVLGNSTLSNRLTLNDTAITGSDYSRNRIWFGNNATSYYQGYGSYDAAITHEFKNNSGGAQMVLYNGGTTNLGLRVYGQIICGIYTIANTNRDLVGVNIEGTNVNNYNNTTLYVINNTFTGFHRCFTEDDLFDITNPQKFKDDYEGRIIISTGKIATDTTYDPNNKDNTEWTILYDKLGITIEDALPQIELSRKKKDKRVFGVLGSKTRQNNRPERLIINSVGEGAIWVCNSNGNVENGDYITSSDYLGYGEKQDEIFLCNYTVAKATMDCNFELDSPLYNCIEINCEGREGLRIAFIAATYHCG